MSDTAVPVGDVVEVVASGDEAERRGDRRAELVAAARAHSAAVARHLDRVAERVRVPIPMAPPAPAATGRQVAVPELATLLLADAAPGALLRTVLDLVAMAVPGADGVSVTLRRDGGVETAAASGPDVSEADRVQYRLGEGPCLDASRPGGSLGPVLAPTLPDPRWPRFTGAARELGWAGIISVPLVTRSGRLGALNIYGRSAQLLDAAAANVAAALAEQVAVALTNARDFHQQQDTAAALQRSLLPGSLPPVSGLAFAVTYRPATSGINVGGDWFDVLALPDGATGLVIGDVAGHGLAAATTMGQLRTAVRAYALEGHPPERVLELVDAYMQAFDPEGYATCLYLVVRPGSGEVRWCSAGHPGPVVVDTAGGVHFLQDGQVPALGVPVTGGRSDAGSAVFGPGTRLLLITDGLVERRGESLDDGLARLADAAGVPAGDHPLERWRDRVVDAQLEGRDVDDDVAVLAVEFAPAQRPARASDAGSTALGVGA